MKRMPGLSKYILTRLDVGGPASASPERHGRKRCACPRTTDLTQCSSQSFIKNLKHVRR